MNKPCSISLGLLNVLNELRSFRFGEKEGGEAEEASSIMESKHSDELGIELLWICAGCILPYVVELLVVKSIQNSQTCSTCTPVSHKANVYK